MDRIIELKKRKKELGYTNETVAEKSGVPLGTVQKVFSGATANPRIDTIEALERVLKSPVSYEPVNAGSDIVRETSAEYAAFSRSLEPESDRVPAGKADHWIAAGLSDRWDRQGQYTTKDYFAAPEDVRIELIDGVIYDMEAEILSPSTRIKDCTLKLRKYMNAGTREYWIVDPEKRKVLVYTFEDDVLPAQYSFDDRIPVGISKGRCSIDLSKIPQKR